MALANRYHSITCNGSVVEIVDAVKSNPVEIQSRKHQLVALNSKTKWDRLKGSTLTLQRNTFVEISAFSLDYTYMLLIPPLCQSYKLSERMRTEFKHSKLLSWVPILVNALSDYSSHWLLVVVC